MADTYVNTAMASSHITSLMRRINALEASSGTPGVFIRKFGSSGSGNGQFNGCLGVSIYNSEIYVADRANSRIQVLDLNGTYVRKWNTSVEPVGVFVSSGEVYVTCRTANLVEVYNTTGTLQRSWTVSLSTGTVASKQLYVGGGLVYVPTGLANDNVEVYSTAGVYQSSIGSGFGSGNGQFNDPCAVFVYGSEIYVVDKLNNRIQVFDSSYVYQRKWGSVGSADGQFDSPLTVFVDNSGYVYVTDLTNDRVQVFNTSGTFQYKFGSAGSGDGEFGAAVGVAVSSSEIYVSDSSLDRVQVFTSSTSGAQTTFYSYTTTTKTSLGTPDGGVSVPALAALTAANNNADLVPRHLVDMRDAIETLAPYFTNAATGNPFNWTASSADNLFFVANGDRTEYGATGGAAYDWTRTEAQMEGDWAYSIDIGEIANCVTTLENS